jgi:phenylalanyl-tRNA synthetase beta chain
LIVTVPSWRASKDISIREDIVEEVIRIYGYDQIAPLHIPSDTSISLRNPTKVLRDSSLDFWKSAHYSEVYNYSFTNTDLEKAIGCDDMTDAVGIQNAFNVEYTHMRRSLSVRLFDNIAKNKNIRESLRFFEIGKVYSKDQVYTDTIS